MDVRSCRLLGTVAAAFAVGNLEKGIIYVQPSYQYTNTLQLDMDVLRKALNRIVAAGFVNVGLGTSWGEIMSTPSGSP